MTLRARLRAGSLLLAIGLLGVGTPAAAFADDAVPPTPAPAAAAAEQRLAAEIVALQRTAERRGEAAERAAERANGLRVEADAAEQALRDAEDAVQAAAVTAAASRARAAVVAARLARTDLGTLPLALMLNGGSARGVLGGLSTAGQLGVQSQLLYATAERDEAAMQQLRAAAAAAATAATTAAAAAATSAAAAERDASAAQREVGVALARQRALLAGDADTAAVCAAAGTVPVGVCLPDASAPTGTSVGADVLAFAVEQIGKPYVFAAAGPGAYDCSGLTLAAYASAGVSIGPHSATAQYRLADAQGDLVPLADARPGDLLFYTDGSGGMAHVTIAAGDGLMIEAPYPGATVREAPVRTAGLAAEAAHFG